jgi:HEPN domain-containing protein
MAGEAPTRQKIEKHLTEAEEAYRNGRETTACISCGEASQAALQWAIRNHDDSVELAEKGLGSVIRQARDLKLPQCNETTVHKLNQITKNRNKAAHPKKGKVTLENARDSMLNTRAVLKALGVSTEKDLSGIRLRVSRKTSNAVAKPLSLDRVTQRGEINMILGSNNNQVHVLGVHGEEEQGHAQCAELIYRQFSHGREGLWKRIDLRWPGKAHPEARLGELVQKLGRALGLGNEVLTGPLDGQIEAVRHKIKERLEQMGPLFVRHTIGTIRKKDLALLQDYLTRVWHFDDVVVFPGVLTMELVRLEPGFWMSDTYRAARKGLKNTHQIVTALQSMRAPQLRGRAITELASVTPDDLRKWIVDNLSANNPEEVLTELWTHSKHGRFELVLNHLPDYTGDLN